ncbi:Ca2+-binding RTX toxin-like protein [Methylopila capsulata]|uniref:Ca2+-binding RTX toxin-like protein n=1 Tax=Methylopila capsulata TaxID=61654 RepID=A0A9W6IT25_9HYPH|nr:calcium-binding protein [Methylopila capsulata]MBM7850688.1 Ca2+-binding RTX toxin-like protein [Methylopila capsulata]GLK55983.1 hypothetical protein GCM10008170_20020 [Methylopila capsulata]
MAQPVNDNIENAIVIAGDGFSFTGTTADATLQVGEPSAYDGDEYADNDADDSVWFVYTASTTGTVVLETEGFNSSFGYNLFLSPDGSSSFASLQEFKSGASFGSSEFYEEFSVVAGETYYIRFASYGYSNGDYTLIQSSGPAGVLPQIVDGGTDTLGAFGDGVHEMIGGDGDDTYYVDNVGDVVTEMGGEGFDTIRTTVDFTLPANVERIVIEGATGRTATGNAFDNTLIGGAGDDTLYGLAGNDILKGRGGSDTMVGGEGDDVYYVDSASDVVTELDGEGYDAVYTTVSLELADNVEKAVVQSASGLEVIGNDLDNSLTGGAGGDRLVGGAGADLISGKAGDDTLSGGEGKDRLAGGAGADVFLFETLSDAGDVITDFVVGEDKIGFGASFDADLLSDPGQFASNLKGVATEADDRLIYSTKTGRLFYDADGSGSGQAVLLATLKGAPELGYGDFISFAPV